MLFGFQLSKGSEMSQAALNLSRPRPRFAHGQGISRSPVDCILLTISSICAPWNLAARSSKSRRNFKTRSEYLTANIQCSYHFLTYLRPQRTLRSIQQGRDTKIALGTTHCLTASGRCQIIVVIVGSYFCNHSSHAAEVFLVIQNVAPILSVCYDYILGLDHLRDLQGPIRRNLLVTQSLYQTNRALDGNALRSSPEQQHALGIINQFLRQRILIQTPHDLSHAILRNFVFGGVVELREDDIGGKVGISGNSNDSLHNIRFLDSYVHSYPASYTSTDQDHGPFDNLV
mmetsp:Transcript_30906/g.48440  ORF Transcript_30906/g.48440 Transcript_30906/m.48440 type:complete len:287 (-) Transcript_30906:511-1371(-)